MQILTNDGDRFMFYRRLFVAATAILIIWVLWTTLDAIIPYIIGLLLAYLLVPVVRGLEKHIPGGEKRAGARRLVAVLIVYFVFFGALAILFVAVGERVVDATANMFNSLSDYWANLQAGDTQLQQWYQENVPESFKQTINENLDEITQKLAGWISTPLTAALDSVSGVLGLIFTLFFIPLFMFYLLIERPTASESVSNHVPDAWRKDISAFGQIVNNSVFNYFRGLTIEGILLGTATGLVLWLMGIEHAVGLGVLTGLAVFIPYVGFWFAFLATIIVVAETDPVMLAPVLIVTGILQIIDNWYLAPKFKGGSVGFTPAQTLFFLAIGAALMGPVGIIIITPIVAVFRDTVMYIYQRLSPQEETATELVEEPAAATD